MSRKRLIDSLVEAYVNWREASARVNDTYRSWASQTAPGDGAGFWQYVAALDAEEEAAEVYGELVRHAEKLPYGEEGPPEAPGGPVWGFDWP